jgi:hypothetical protein
MAWNDFFKLFWHSLVRDPITERQKMAAVSVTGVASKIGGSMLPTGKKTATVSVLRKKFKTILLVDDDINLTELYATDEYKIADYVISRSGVPMSSRDGGVVPVIVPQLKLSPQKYRSIDDS